MGAQNDWTKATYDKFTALKNQIEDFAGQNADFTNFNTEGLTNFIEYLRKKLEMKNSSIAKKYGFLKWFLRWPKARDIIMFWITRTLLRNSRRQTTK